MASWWRSASWRAGTSCSNALGARLACRGMPTCGREVVVLASATRPSRDAGAPEHRPDLRPRRGRWRRPRSSSTCRRAASRVDADPDDSRHAGTPDGRSRSSRASCCSPPPESAPRSCATAESSSTEEPHDRVRSRFPRRAARARRPTEAERAAPTTTDRAPETTTQEQTTAPAPTTARSADDGACRPAPPPTAEPPPSHRVAADHAEPPPTTTERAAAAPTTG